jgi:polysaccharide export outer membrane protein
LWIDVPAIESGAVNPLMRDGDALFVFQIGGFHELPAVEINGEVVRPGMYPITLGRDHLSDLVEWAGGFRPHANRSAIFLVRAPESAAGSDVEFERLLRLSKSEMTESEFASFRTRMAERKNAFRVDFDRLKEAAPGVDPLLRPGDVVRVDPLVLSVRVDGEVKHPGLIEFTPGRTWAEYAKLAGGFTDRAFSSATRVSRSGTGQVIEARNVKSIQPGDFIWVPERRDVDAWQLFKDVITIAAQLSVIVVAIAR